MSRRARLTWAMPEWLIRLALRLMLRSSGKSGIHTSLRFRMRSEPPRSEPLSGKKTSGMLLSGIKLTMEDVDAFRSLAGTFGDTDFLGGRTADWRPTIIAGFGAMMKAAPLFTAPEARAMVTDDTKWNELWNSLRDIVRNASKEAMKDAEGGWTELWAAAWETLRPEIRDACRVTLKELTDLTKTLPDSHLHIDVKDTGSHLPHVSRSEFIPGLADTMQSELQPYMVKLIRDHGRVVGRFRLGSPAQVEKDIREAMDRVWRVVVDLDGGDANGSGDHKADVSQPPYMTER
ncbi:hypothetical protein BS47DRAFT_1402356 [Hydnum rufescens UP504]|uniref:Uncharacterized protein n=1 Tax=Hydnum rufescens UP504 TaxID=1448309 RepID=A0A9P6DF98_9AGAM|nr:hypothetical protein BS47DRAFT_1402356 [Hydnum rufescens UP504]